MDRRIAIGIDGGATKTNVLVKEKLEGELLFEQTFDSSNYNNIGIIGIKEVFKEIYVALSKTFNINELRHAKLVLGSAGIDRPQDIEIYKNALVSSGFSCEIEIFNDAYIALFGANGGRKDALLILGTGSISLGISEDGEEVRTGGWGALISDHGSGYKLGIKAISAVMDHYDGVIDHTSLTEHLLNYYQLNSPEEFMEMLYNSEDLPVTKIASSAPIILKQYELGDVTTKNIVELEINEVCKMIVALSKKMKMKRFKLSVAGSLALKSDAYYSLLNERLAEYVPYVKLSKPLHEPVVGALMIALESINRRVRDD